MRLTVKFHGVGESGDWGYVGVDRYTLCTLERIERA